MRNAIIIHGVGDSRTEFMNQKYCSGKSWKDRLQFELLHRDILAQQPQMPHRYIDGMKYEQWEHVFKQFEILPDTILLGHSAGGGFLLRYLSEHPEIRAAQLILVAPWIDPDGIAGDFYKFELDKDLVSRFDQMDLFFSTDDDDYILKSAKKICETYPNMNVHESQNNGHFDGNDYPELLEAIK